MAEQAAPVNMAGKYNTNVFHINSRIPENKNGAKNTQR